MYIYYSIGNNSGPRTLVRIVEVSVIGGVRFRRFHCRSNVENFFFSLYVATSLSCIISTPVIVLQILSIAGSPTVTSLTFDDQSRTLTCTSTGGPAPNVTWRRDGVVITLNTTYQQTKSVVDAVNGTYQTVLTIDPSVSWSDIVGTYNCTVENDSEESSDTVVVPGET